MKVHREDLVRRLASVSPGLGKGTLIEQSTCFVFSNGKIYTFNDEVACSIDSPLMIEGAIPAEKFIGLLNRLQEDFVTISVKENELRVTGKGSRSRAGLHLDAKVVLPIDKIETAEEWKILPEEFTEAMDLVRKCAGRKSSDYLLTSVHFMPGWIEAVDDVQLCRCELGIEACEESMLLSADSMKDVVGLGMTEMSVTSNWAHFRNAHGLVYSCRRRRGAFPVLTDYLKSEGSSISLPAGLEEGIKNAELFLDEHMKIRVDRKAMLIEGRCADGWFQKQYDSSFEGEPFEFSISPDVLRHILATTNECRISSQRLYVENQKFKYVACLAVTA